jgi:transcriptional regulator with XRE-family HTH domain
MYSHPQRRSTKLTQKLRNQAGVWLRELREKRGLSQREMAEKVGAEYYTFISQLENGRGRIPPDRYLVWAAALGVEPRAFVRTLMSYYDPVTYKIIFGEGPKSEPQTRVRRSSLPSPNVERGRRRRLSPD